MEQKDKRERERRLCRIDENCYGKWRNKSRSEILYKGFLWE